MDPTKEDLDAVFLGADKPPPSPEGAVPPTVDEDAEMEAALDESIDEVFASEDPVMRREAFKRAIRLCKDSAY